MGRTHRLPARVPLNGPTHARGSRSLSSVLPHRGVTPLAVCLSIAILAAPSAAVVWTVLPDGSGDMPTIQAAIDAAAAGDQIIAGDGVFTGPGNTDILVG